MNEFNLWEFAHLAIELEHLSEILRGMAKDGLGATSDPEFYGETLSLIRRVLSYARYQQFNECVATVSASERDLKITNRNADISSLATEIRHVRDALLHATSQRRFLRVDLGRSGYINRPNLLGEDIAKAFPSAKPDIREAGNCLAADCNTAAVFHMMRVVEWGLRTLCVHLGFRKLRQKYRKSGTVSYVPIEYSEWEKILNQLQDRVDAKILKVKRGTLKQEYQEFYYPALQDIRGIRDAWRNHVMHTRQEYGSKDADAILEHVKRLMNTLAMRIREV
jgi:hypothetical protein